MDFNNGLYVFNGVPGIEASKGERISKALHKLQTKMKHLEQVRDLERESSSNSGKNDSEDITLSDVQLNLLYLQLRYARNQLRKTRPDEGGITAVESQQQHEQSKGEYSDIENYNKGTQTNMSLCDNMPSTTATNESAPSHIEETLVSSSLHPTVLSKEASTTTDSNLAYSSHNKLPSESALTSSKDIQTHYHLNIDDVPFILGSSVSNSHNLIANVQGLLAKMKTHSKALCGPRFKASENHCESSAAEKNCSEDMDKTMRELSKGLTEMQIKQANEIERVAKHKVNQLAGNQEKDTQLYDSEIKRKQAKKFRTTNSTSAHGSGKVHLKENRQLKLANAIKKNKHAVPTNKIQTNLPQVARQRLLRSIKEMNTRLTEDDISWV